MILIKPVFATCPVCVITVGGGLWLAKRLGVDDLIAAIWIGSLTTAFAVALSDKWKMIKLPKFLLKKWIDFRIIYSKQ